MILILHHHNARHKLQTDPRTAEISREQWRAFLSDLYSSSILSRESKRKVRKTNRDSSLSFTWYQENTRRKERGALFLCLSNSWSWEWKGLCAHLLIPQKCADLREDLTISSFSAILHFPLHLSVCVCVCMSFFTLLSSYDKGYGHHFGLEYTQLVSISKPYVYSPLKRAGEKEWKCCMCVSVLLPDRKLAVTNCQKIYRSHSINTVCARTEHTDVNQVSKYTFFSSIQCHFF